MNGSPPGWAYPGHGVPKTALPNYELDVELGALGAPLVLPEVLPAMIGTGLQPECFYRREHQAIWRAMLALHQRGQTLSLSLVRVELQAQGWEQIDGRNVESFLTYLVTECGNALAGPSQAQTVIGSYHRRRAMDAARLWYRVGIGKGDPGAHIARLLRAQATTFAQPAAAPARLDPWADVISGPDLAALDVPALVEWIPGLFTEGFILLIGAPKVGKSWMLMHLFRALALGSLALGSLRCLPSRVLLCSLEDGQNRTARRWQAMNAALAEQEGGIPEPIDFKFSLPPLDMGGLDFLESYLARYAGPPGSEQRVCIGIDTLVKVRPDERDSARSAGLYERDHRFVSSLTDLSRRFACCLVTSHHNRKLQSGDLIDASSGTHGLPAAADTIMYLKSSQEQPNVISLDVRGRDLEGASYRVTRDVEHATWTIAEAPAGPSQKVTPRQEEVLRAAQRLSAGGATFQAADAAAKVLGMSRGSAANMLAELERTGLVARLGSNRDTRWSLTPSGWAYFGEPSSPPDTEADDGDDGGLF